MLTAWNAFPLLDRLFDDVMSGATLGAATTQSTFTPTIDVRLNQDEIVFVCDVPGVQREDLEITLEARVLCIKGQRRYRNDDRDRVLLGRSYGAFAKRFTLPDSADAAHMTADLTDGVLTIKVPKQPQAKPRRIEIGSGKDL
jgi:HSP20 family protein